MYIFADKDEVKSVSKWCETIIKQVQVLIKDYFTFDFRLIGSGEKKLVTLNSGDGNFDLDYNLILQKDKKDLLNNPKKIKELFRKYFDEVLTPYEFNYSSDSTSVITVKLVQDKKIHFSFDVAIIVENNNGMFYKLIFDKKGNRYFWNEVKNSSNYFERVNAVKKNGEWAKFMNRYLELKNMHLSRGEAIKSFSVFLETLNDLGY